MTRPTYNTQKTRLRMPQYGRGVQMMVDHTIGVADRRQRQRLALLIIKTMASMVPGARQESVYRRLWDHLAYMSDYKLDIDYPYETTRMGAGASRPARVAYPHHEIRQRQYGHLVECAAKKLREMDDGPARRQLTALVANRMKQTLADWNRDAMDDHKVALDLRLYTEGAVALPERFTFARVDFTPLVQPTGKKKKRRK